MSQTVTIGESQSGARLDKALSDALPDYSRSRLKTLIQEGAVGNADGTLTDPAYRVKPGDALWLREPPAAPAEPVPQSIPLDIIFEDEHVLVVNKPAGLVVHPAAGNPDGTLVNALLAHCGEALSGIGGVRRPGIVHRLDKDTSGLMVVAKTDLAHRSLADQFAAHSLARAYQALVWGTPKPPHGSVSSLIGRSPNNRKKMAVVSRNGKSAVTHYKKLAAVGSAASLMECRLETGRTHQIRVHMAHLGHPVIGDPLYGGGLTAQRAKKLSGKTGQLEDFHRQALHAYLIGFLHPVNQRELRFEEKLPHDINELINFLEMV
ncbi:MAG: RluA family pseudouridine synthase [Magnetospiraceae bacterium]